MFCRFLPVVVIGLLGMLSQARAADLPADWQKKFLGRDLPAAPGENDTRWVVLVFISPECPLANASIPVLNALVREFAAADVKFVGVYADPALPPSALRAHATGYGLLFPTVDDRQHQLACATGATYTPEVFVYAQRGALVYRGRIDDRVQGFGAAKPVATHEDLREVLVALIAGRPSPFATRPGFGCAISKAKPELCGDSL